MNKILVFTFVLGLFVFTVNAQKMKADEIIAKSLEAIGKKDVREKLKNLTITGEVEFSQGPTSGLPANGKSVFVSDGNKTLMAMTFPIPIYPMEKVVFDGKNLSVAFVRPGVRSAFGEYLLGYDEIVKEGLLSGTLSTSWSLSNLQGLKAKVSTSGEKKIEGREAYTLTYAPKKGSDVEIRIYIDRENFQHLRTEYRRVIAAQMGSNPNLSSSQTENLQTLTEDFSNFKTINGVSLPHSYKLRLFVEKGKATREYYYFHTLKDFYFNQQLDPATFNTSN